MAFYRARPGAHRRVVAAAVAAGWALVVGAGAARADRNDLQLLGLCAPHAAPGIGAGGAAAQECSWIQRNDPATSPANGRDILGVSLNGDAQTRFRSLMSELGVVIAPRLQTPADTLGYAGFQFSAELGVTKINSGRDYWNGVAGQNPANPAIQRDSYITTVGGFVRKGLWLPLPAFEFGAGAMSILGSHMYVVQGYAKIALQEGFHGWALPSFAVRGSASQLLGTDQVDLNVYGIDVLLSKAFGIAGTARIEPFVGWNILFIDAQSGVIDATPGCDGVALAANPTSPPAGCSMAAPVNRFNDLNANFTFPQQDVITRQRWSVGFKLKMSVLFLVGEFDLAPAGHSVDSKQPAAARDTSGTQQSYALSAGFDF
ncbi:MAG TPA: hypothetical protein VHJ20_20185 [Polyangia bacterium]|nr:hypothetical protein [Polyangia bacterium]